jgi:hypothetical protein
MTKPMIRIHDLSTGDVIDREMNAEEFAAWEKVQEEEQAISSAKAKAEADKAALLARLGLTEDELQTILG